MLSASCQLKRKTLPVYLVWIGWFLMIVGLFMPVINLPIPDLQVIPLLFGGAIPNVDELGSAKVLAYHSIKGYSIITFMFSVLTEKVSLTIEWVIFLLLSIPVLTAYIAPLLLYIRLFFINTFIMIIYSLGLVFPVFFLLASVDDSLIEEGYYIWTLALFILCVSYFLICFPVVLKYLKRE